VTVPTIPGWIEQWYGKLPTDGNVMLNVPPGAIPPEFQAPPFATEVCVIESLLVHVTVAPTDTVTGFGEYAVVVSVDDPVTIDTGVPDVGDVVVDGEDELQATERLNRKMTSAVRRSMSNLLRCSSANPLPIQLADSHAPIARTAHDATR
jgi:hypothetical protein